MKIPQFGLDPTKPVKYLVHSRWESGYESFLGFEPSTNSFEKVVG